jgi:hypothetical protein
MKPFVMLPEQVPPANHEILIGPKIEKALDFSPGPH